MIWHVRQDICRNSEVGPGTELGANGRSHLRLIEMRQQREILQKPVISRQRVEERQQRKLLGDDPAGQPPARVVLALDVQLEAVHARSRSEERRVGKEGRSRSSLYY